MAELPRGVVTFVLTDIEGSTRLWEDAPDAMPAALARHDEIVDEIAAANNGTSVKSRGEGDSHFLVFAEPDAAVRAAAQLQTRLADLDAGLPRPLRVRIALSHRYGGCEGRRLLRRRRKPGCPVAFACPRWPDADVAGDVGARA